MTFTPAEECVAPGSTSNASKGMIMVFLIGFLLHMINYVIATFVEPILRRELAEKIEREGISSETRRLFWTSFLLEHLFRVIFVLFSLYQLITVGSPAVVFCS